MKSAAQLRSSITYASYGFRSGEVAEMTGISLRQLQWWDEQGIVCPQFRNGHGRGWRSYSVADIERLFILSQMREKGLSLQKASKILKAAGGRMNHLYIAVTIAGPLKVFASDYPADIVAEIGRWTRPMILIETLKSVLRQAA